MDLNELNRQLEAQRQLQNNSPIDDFDGLSASEFHNLFYNPYSKNSIVYIQDDISKETLRQVPLFNIALDLINIINRDNFIKLTPKGFLPKKVLLELYEPRHITDFFVENGFSKVHRETDFIFFTNVKILLELSEITETVNDKIILTKKGKDFLNSEKELMFFETFLYAFTEMFIWNFNDGYPENEVGQRAWAYSIYLLSKYGNEYKPYSFYAKKYLDALPFDLDQFENIYAESAEKNYFNCYEVRTFSRFMLWFGLAENEISDKRSFKAFKVDF
jgi:hypothetical protein